MLNAILAVIAGFVVWSVLWLGGNRLVLGLFSGAINADGAIRHTGALIALLAFSVVVSIIAGFVVPKVEAVASLPLILGVILLLVGIFFQSQSWQLFPIWYHITFLALLIPATLIGAGLGR